MTVRTVVVKTKLGEEGERRKGQGDRKKNTRWCREAWISG
jgi:hypothetical protein